MEDLTDVTGICSFLGVTLFYPKFIPSNGEVAIPLYELTSKGSNVRKQWRDDLYGGAVDKLKEA